MSAILRAPWLALVPFARSFRSPIVPGGRFPVVPLCAMGVSAVTAAIVATAASSPGPAPGALRFWVADRDAGELVGLDSDLLVVARVAVAHPVEVEARADGGAWVVSAPAANPLGPHVLRRISPSGAAALEVALGVPLDLACADGDVAVAVEIVASGGREVATFDASGVRRVVAVDDSAFCAAMRGREVLVGTEHGALQLWAKPTDQAPSAGSASLSRRPLAQREVGGWIADVAPGPARGTWWILDASSAGRVLLVDRALGTVWERPTSLRPLHLAPVPRSERVWLADAAQPLVERFGPGGALEIAPLGIPAAGLDRAVGLAGGGLVLVAPGAVLRLGPQGQPQPGQGGFDFAVDVADVASP